MDSILWKIIFEKNPDNVYQIFFALGTFVFIGGILFAIEISPLKKSRNKFKISRVLNAFKKADDFSNKYLLKKIKQNVKEGLVLFIESDETLSIAAFITAVTMIASGLFLGTLLTIFGTIWYTKTLLFLVGLILPYYAATLFLDYLKMKSISQIPVFLDEFRGAFSREGRLIPALIESGLSIDKTLGRLIYRAAGNAQPIKSLRHLKKRINNVWFDIFVTILENYKSNGGELILQLYRLNRTMTRQMNIDKKKNKRLVLYEMFAISSAIVGIPICIYLNGIFLGTSFTYGSVENNVLLVKLTIYCLLALVVTRLLRKA